MKTKKNLISYLLLLLMLVYLVIYIKGHVNDFRILLSVGFSTVFIIAVMHLCSLFMNGLFIKLSVQPFQKRIDLYECFFVSLISTMGNYFLPVGVGTGIKAVYLKRKVKLAYTDFMATLSGNYIIVFMLNAGLGLLALIMIWRQVPKEVATILATVLSIIFLSMIYLAIFGFPRVFVKLLEKLKVPRKLISLTQSVMDGWKLIISHKNLMVNLILISLANFALVMAMTYVAGNSLGISMKVFPLILYAALGSLSILLNITPGSIGIKEAIFIFSSTALGLTIPQILSISIIVNGTLFFVLIVSWLTLRVPVIKKRFIPTDLSRSLS